MAVTRRLDRAVRLGAFGMVLVLAFVAARATSFHHVDELLGTRALYLRVNWILEIGGIAVVIAGGAARRRRLIDTGKPRRKLGSGHGREQTGQRRETPRVARYD